MFKPIYLYILFFILFCFGLSLTGDFVFDDTKAIVNNKDVYHNDIILWNLFKNDFWGNNIASNYSHKSYRPLTILTFRLIQKLSTFIEGDDGGDSMKPFYFHLVNLIFYYILCCLLHETLCLFLMGSIVNLSKSLSIRMATYVTLLFTIHPIHSESICSCVGLADIMSGLFSTLAFNYHLSNNHTLHSIPIKHFQIIKYFIQTFFTILLITISFLYKEQGITFLGILMIIDLFQLKQLYNGKIFSNVKLLFIQLIIYLMMLLMLILIRLSIMNYSLPRFDIMDNPSTFIDHNWYRMLNYVYIYCLNAFIIICPIWLCFDWSMGCVPLIQSFGDYRLLFVMLFIISIIIFLARIMFIKHLRIMILFSLLFILPFVPSSNLLFQVGFVIAERNLFMPILGYLLILIYSLNLSSRRYLLLNKLANYGIVLLLLIFALRSFNRTLIWRHERSLFGRDVDVCPRNAKIWYNMGKIAADDGDTNRAINYYSTSLRLYPNYTSALNNLANIYKDIGVNIKAKELLERTIQIDSTFAAAWMNLAIVEMSLKNFHLSEKYFLNSLSIRPQHSNTHFNLGNLYLEMKQFAKAEEAFLKAVHLDTKSIKSWKNLILLLQKDNQIEKAFNHALKAIESNPNDNELHFLIANLYGLRNDFQLAVHYFNLAIDGRPTEALYRYNLAVLYHQHKMYKMARKNYEMTLRIDGNYKNAIKQLKKLENLIGRH